MLLAAALPADPDQQEDAEAEIDPAAAIFEEFFDQPVVKAYQADRLRQIVSMGPGRDLGPPGESDKLGEDKEKKHPHNPPKSCPRSHRSSALAQDGIGGRAFGGAFDTFFHR